MKATRLIGPTLGLLAGLLLPARAQDPLKDHLFPPELVMEHAPGLGLTDEQKDFFKTELDKAKTRFREFQDRLAAELAALAQLLKPGVVESEPAVRQLDKVLDLEREMRRFQLQLSIRIKNYLTPEQQAQLQKLKKPQDSPAAQADLRELQKSLEAKSQKIKAAAQRWQEAGRDLTPVREIMEQVDRLMKEGKPKEALPLLDQALKLLEAPAGNSG